MRVVASVAVAAAFLCAAALAQGEARPYDHIVAIVGDRVILQSEAIARIPRFRETVEKVPALDRPNLVRRLVRSQVEAMIDENLEESYATTHGITVERDEVDRALGEIARSNQLDVKGLLAEAARQGFSESAYREQLERQILDAKIVRRAFDERHFKVTDEELTATDARKAELMEQKRASVRRELLASLRKATYVELRIDP
jgi:peptidyl-prolyl cis-trans isomerase SurA